MYHVKLDDIREMTTNGPTYMQGRQYYRQGRVRHIDFDRDKGVIRAQVEGSRMYNIRIILNSRGELHDAICTCSAFASYWGFCRHIAAVLLAGIDQFSKRKTRIVPEVPAVLSDSAGTATGVPDAGIRAGTEPRTDVAQEMGKSSEIPVTNEPDGTDGSSANTVLNRRNRSRTRDFLARLDHVIRIDDPQDKQTIRLSVLLRCARSGNSLPWLSFAIGSADRLYPIANVEQFAEALARGLLLEVDKDFAYQPLQHRFPESDQPLVNLLIEAFENDYKAVFGTSHAASKAQCLTLNATRFADFLSFAGELSEAAWQLAREPEIRPIRVCHERLPVAMLLSPAESSGTPADASTGASAGVPAGALVSVPAATAVPHSTGASRLELLADEPPYQMTAARNVYLVGTTFYLPDAATIRVLEPILSTFHVARRRTLQLTRTETVHFLSNIAPTIEAVCPVHLHPDIAAAIRRADLRTQIQFTESTGGLRADIEYRYDERVFTPWLDRNEPETADRELLLRDFAGEQKVLALLQDAGFIRQGNALLLDDPDEIYRFLDRPLCELRRIADVSPREDQDGALQILPAPVFRFALETLPDRSDLILRQDLGGLPPEEFAVYLQALRDRRMYYRTRSGAFRQVAGDDRDALLHWQEILDNWQIAVGADSVLLPRYRALALDIQDRDGPGLEIRIAPPIRKLIANLEAPGSLTCPIPADLRRQLRPYQRIGVSWLHMLEHYGLGGILADDMGLGKTLQAITAIAMTWQRTGRPSLVVAPTSLLYNWLHEFAKFAPNLPVILLEGNRRQRSELIQAIDNHACAITSYSLLRRDIDHLSEVPFASCFLDEAQNIKNPETQSARSVRMLTADHVFALTGTPVENNLLDLWSIFDSILPGYLHSQSVFLERYEIPLREGNRAVLENLSAQIKPFILRRLKKDVLKELPDKIESHAYCVMTDEQRALYDAFLNRSRRDLRQELDTNGYARSQIYILALLTRLRQICCHPGLFSQGYHGGSGKLAMLEELLEDSFAGGHRVLVFSQFTTMLDIIRQNQEARGVWPFLISGQVSSEERLQQVQRFNDGEGKLFLISLRAGGTGLNLTGADTVIHYDPWWNPAVEDQATDRAYRIGQENVVHVIKLLARDSVEEKILALQQKKQQMIDDVIAPEQNLLSKMTLEEVLSLFDT